MTNIAGSGSGSIRQRHGSADPDTDVKQLQQFGEFLQAVPTRYCPHVAALTNALKGSVADPDPNPDGSTCFWASRIRIH
jgi:hypothetical protein